MSNRRTFESPSGRCTLLSWILSTSLSMRAYRSYCLCSYLASYQNICRVEQYQHYALKRISSGNNYHLDCGRNMVFIKLWISQLRFRTREVNGKPKQKQEREKELEVIALGVLLIL